MPIPPHLSDFDISLGEFSPDQLTNIFFYFSHVNEFIILPAAPVSDESHIISLSPYLRVHLSNLAILPTHKQSYSESLNQL